MKKWLLLASVWIIAATLYSQQQHYSISDTVLVDEVVVAVSIPLDDASMARRYQTQYSSSIDKINSRLGGVSLISRGAYAMEPMLNSFSAGQINITIDGMKMFGACTDKMDPITSYVEPINLKSIELHHGTAGSENGSTIGGTFNMTLQSPQLNSQTATGGILYESISKGRLGFAKFNYGSKKWAYLVNGIYKKYEEYTDGNNEVVPFTQYEKFNIFQSLLYEPAIGHQIKLDVLIDDAIYVGYPALPMDVGKAKGRIYSLDYKTTEAIGILNNFRGKLYVNTVYHLMDDSKRDSLYLVENDRTNTIDSVYMKMDMPGWSNTYGAFAEGVFQLSEYNVLQLKGEGYFNWSKAEMTMYMNNLSNPGEPPMYAETWPENQRHVIGLYLNDTHALNDNVIIGLDGRIDYSSAKVLSEIGKQQFQILGYDVSNPYRNLTKSINTNFSLRSNGAISGKFAFGYGERGPTPTEQFGFFLYNALDGYDYIGNPDIENEQTIHFQLSVNYTKPKFRISGSAYYNHVSNYILGITKDDYDALNLYASGVKQYENLNWADVFAANLQLIWKPIPSLEVFTLTKYNYGKMVNGEALPLIAPLKNLLSIMIFKNNWDIQPEIEYSAKQKRINRNYGESPTDEYFIFHMRGTYKWQLSQMTLKLNGGIENVFNQVYSEHLDWGNYYRPGRNVYAGLSMDF